MGVLLVRRHDTGMLLESTVTVVSPKLTTAIFLHKKSKLQTFQSYLSSREVLMFDVQNSFSVDCIVGGC